MLGWALKKGFQGATGLRDAPEAAEDTTQFEAPDTPAPVFAARAIKNALWGETAATEPKAPAEGRQPELANRTSEATSSEPKSPTKLNSILLTPGTGTARRKRVSFGHDVKAANNVDSSPSSHRAGRQRRRTTLQQALENSRSTKTKQKQDETREKVPDFSASEPCEDALEDEWEDDVFDNDVTVDLNEPHSQSGKYWKGEFDKYRTDAVSDMEKLVKYKANAKSFAEKKDHEANLLSQKLKEEQAKVTQLEEKITELAAQLGDRKRRNDDRENARLVKDLAKQTALAVQYRDQVKDLEKRLKEVKGESDQRGIDTTPRTEQNLHEISLELRKARSELRQLDRLRGEVTHLKSDLEKSRQRVQKLEQDKVTGVSTESAKVQELRTQLREVKDQSRQKDHDMRKLKKDYESLKKDAKARTAEALEVLEDKNTKIAEMEKMIKSLRAANESKVKAADEAAPKRHNRSRDLRSNVESLIKSSKHEKSKPTNRPRRSASVDDNTLDMTQRSLFSDKNDFTLDRFVQDKIITRPKSADWTDSLLDIDNQLKRDKKERMEAGQREKKQILEDEDTVPLLQAHSRKVALPPENRRVVSDIMSSRNNKPSPTYSAKRRLADRDDKYYQDRVSRRVASARLTRGDDEDKALMHGALEKNSSQTQKPGVGRPSSVYSEMQQHDPPSDTEDVDLFSNHYPRVDEPTPMPAMLKVTGNGSRCQLSADRLAAARARLEQKKLQRQKAGSMGLDKENRKPELA